jgi:hypothetical protein
VPFVLRKIRKAKWYKHENVPWLKADELQADALGDLYTENNALFVWFVTNDKSNLQRVAAALAGNCEYLSNLDYALLNIELIADLNMKMVQKAGDSADETANSSWHYDLTELSAVNLIALAKMIFTRGESLRYSEKEICRFLAQGISLKQLDRTKIKLRPEAMAKIDALIPLNRLDV